MRLYAEATTFDEEKLSNDIESKRQTFTVRPSPPYAVGDLWLQGENGDIMVCTTARASGSYTASDWNRASKYTDDEGLTEWIEGAYAETIAEIGQQIDGKAETFYQERDPSLDWSAEAKANHKGDLWYKTTDNTTWYYTGSVWIQQNVPDAVFDEIDGKSRIWTTMPVPPYFVGDLWFSSASSDILTCMNAKTERQSFAQSDWVKRNKYTDDSVANSKNKTFYATYANRPTTSLTIGDVFYCTDRDNQPYRWDGSAWVTVRDGMIETAAGTASKFIAELSNGIFVHPESSRDEDKSPSAGTGVWITDAISIVRNGLSYIWAGVENNIAKIRIGLVTAAHVILSSNGLAVRRNNHDLAEFGYKSTKVKHTDGWVGWLNDSFLTLGRRTTNSDIGKNSVSIGERNTVDSQYSMALGTYCEVTDAYSSVIGSYLKAIGRGQFVIGNYNTPDTDKAFVIGNSKDQNALDEIYRAEMGEIMTEDEIAAYFESKRNNIFAVDWDGNVDANGLDAQTVGATTVNATTVNATTINSTTVNAANIQCGVNALNTCNPNAMRDTYIAFPKAFSKIPCVTVTFSGDMSSVNFANVQIAIVGVNTTSFTVRFYNATNAERTPYIHWIATTSGS